MKQYDIKEIVNIKDINNIINNDYVVYKDILLYNIVKSEDFVNLINSYGKKETSKFYKDTEYVLLNLINYCISKIRNVGYIFNNGKIEDDIYYKVKYSLSILDIIFNLRKDLKLVIYQDEHEVLETLLLVDNEEIIFSQIINSVSGNNFLSKTPIILKNSVKYKQIKNDYNKKIKFNNRRFSLAFILGLVKESDFKIFEETFIKELEYNTLTELLNIYIYGSDLIKEQIKKSKDFYLIKEDLKFIEEGLL